MFYVKQNETTASLKRVPILMVDETDGATPETGLTLYPEVSINGGAYAGAAGTWSEVGYGVYYYQLDSTEISTLGWAGIHVTASGARNYDAIAQIAAFNMYSAAGVGITAGDVWSYDISAETTAGTAGSQLNLAALPSGAGATAGDVWDYVIGGDSAQFLLGNINTNVNNLPSANTIRDAVWNAQLDESAGFSTSPPYASGLMSQAGTAATTLPADVWSYATRTLTSGGGATAGDIWTYDISAITTSGTAGSQLNLAAIPSGGAGLTAGDVWDFNITGFGVTGSAAEYVTQTNFTVGNIETYVANQTPQDIWTYAGIEGRTITGGSVTSVVDPVSITTAAMAGVANTVWTVASRTITGGTADTVTSVTNTVDISTQSVTDIWSEDVSSYSTPSAGYDLTQAASGGAGITAGDVWSYDISAIVGAGLAGSQLNLAASAIGATSGDIATAVWDYTGTTIPTSTKETLESANTYASNASSQTGASAIRDAVWDTDLSFLSGTTQAAGILYEAAAGTTLNAPSAVWSYATRTLTSGGGITAGDVWSYDISAITSAGTAGSQLNLAALPSGGSGLTAGDVWAYDITSAVPNSSAEVLNFAKYYADVAQANTNDIGGTVWGYNATLGGSIPAAGGYLVQAGDATTTAITAADVWSYSPRTITGGSVTSVVDGVTVTTNNDKTGYSLSASQTFDLTGNITGNLSGSVGSVTANVGLSTATQSSIANSVWGYATRTLTSSGTAITAGDVWDYAGGRTITGGTVADVTNPVSITTASMSGVAGTIWNSAVASYSTNGTYGKLVLRSDQASQTGNVTLRSAAGINMVDADVHRIDNDVDAATNLKNALTGIGASWTGNVVGNVTGSVNSVVNPVDVSSASMSGIANTVWTAATKTITGGTVDTVTNPVNVSSASMSGVAGTVWSYGSRTLTSGAGATAGDIWTYNIASISTSGTAAKQLNDAAVSGSVVTVVNGPYVLTSIAEGTDGQLDILRNSVQSIQLNLVDGNGSPFNIGGNYTVDVDVYDVSGALAANYTPTVDFAGNGIISFDIDTDVTGTDGRYTLVVSLTDGDVIKLGPLNILVRPL